MAIKILIVDDNTAVRSAIRSCLDGNPQLEVCGEASNGRAAVDVANRLHPDVVILDVSMPVMNGLEAARELVALSPRPEIVLFTAYDGEVLQEDLQALGIKIVVSKNDKHMVEQLRESVLRSSGYPC
ncbi:MAG TPA: response regulator [Terriglobales bacterium]|jgi:DNA-binding NarL/FixJ family response regulator|nr:response regulator [Terriglobales bacterium]